MNQLVMMCPKQNGLQFKYSGFPKEEIFTRDITYL